MSEQKEMDDISMHQRSVHQVKREYWIESTVVWWHLPIIRGCVCHVAYCWLNDTLVRHRMGGVADPLVNIASTI